MDQTSTSLRIEGYAVVSDDDRIADASGQMPDCLRNDAEWAFFQAGLDEADVCVLGRRSHDVTPNPKGRRRLILTRSIAAAPLIQPGLVYWNPEGAPLQDALALFDVEVQSLAITGGRDVFDFFCAGPDRFTAFHLSRVHGTRLPDGVGVFSAVQTGGLSAEDILTGHGYAPVQTRVLDQNVDVVTWCPVSNG